MRRVRLAALPTGKGHPLCAMLYFEPLLPLCRATMIHWTKFGRRVVLALLLSVSFAARAADLTVSAAASLTDAFRELAAVFESRNPGTKVLLNFGASEALLAQIAKGAPVDVFASADEETMDRAAEQNLLLGGSRRDFAGNSLVVVTPPGGPALARLAELSPPRIARIALGNPASVPAGRYARAALEAAGLWSRLEPKFVFAQNVRQALDYVARGEVDAGFVYATDARAQAGKLKVAFEVTAPTPVRYPIAVIAGTSQGDAARRFTEVVLSPQGQAALQRYGFSRP